MEAQPREIENYLTDEGRSPFSEWRDSLRDRNARVKINTKIRQVSLGNIGDYKSVGEGVFEFRIDYGPGYRVYFGQIGQTAVLLLWGGDKSTQQQDITKAKEYWADYEKRKNAKRKNAKRNNAAQQ